MLTAPCHPPCPCHRFTEHRSFELKPCFLAREGGGYTKPQERLHRGGARSASPRGVPGVSSTPAQAEGRLRTALDTECVPCGRVR